MDQKKKAEFVRKMGKKRLKLTKRQHLEGGGIAGLLGSAGGVGGTGFNIPSGTNAEQINQAYNQNQNALKDQGQIANVLEPGAVMGTANQNVLAGQYANQAAGYGPNVAQNQLAQATAGNVANQAALMAGQRGAGANPALLARQAAMTGATAQQGAAGQAATLQAQQQIAAQQAQAQLAANQIAQAQGAVNAQTGAQQAEQGILQGANTANNAITGNLANTTLGGQQQVLGGAMKGASNIAAGLLNEGGEVHGPKKLDFIHKMTKLGMENFHGPKMSDGGEVQTGAQSFEDSLRKRVGDPTKAQETAAQTTHSGFHVGFPKAEANPTPHYATGGITVQPMQTYQAAGNPFMSQNVSAPQMSGSSGSPDLQNVFGNLGSKQPAQVKGQKPSAQDQISADNAAMMGGVSEVGPQTQQSISQMNNEMMHGHGDVPMASNRNPGGLAPLNESEGGELHPHFNGPHENIFANYFMARGGAVPAMVSPGEVYLNPEQVHQVIHQDADPAQIGHKFSGKAKVKGDSKKNDNIPVTLVEGGVVVDRENMGSAEKRKLFVHRAMAKKRSRR